LTGAERRALILVLGFLTFASVYASVVMAPVLTQIAAEFGISTGAAGLVVAAYGAPGIVVAVLAGPYSDRFGRKRFLVWGSAIMGVFTLLAAFATSFPVLVATRMVAGVGASVIYPNSNAILGDNFPYGERARAVATVIGLNTMASVIGVPLAGIIAEATSWRVSVAMVGALSLVAAGVLFRRLRPAQVALNDAKVRELYRSIVTKPSAVAAIVSSLLGSLYWFTWSTYVVVFFEVTFGLSEGVASTIALTQGLGVLIGSQLGGRIGARVGHRPVVAGSVVISGALLAITTNVTSALALTAGLTLAVAAVMGARFASNTTLLTEQVPEARGTLLALSGSVTSLSVVAGATIGGVLIDAFGFWSLGLFCLVVSVLASLVVALFVREEPIDLEISSAA